MISQIRLIRVHTIGGQPSRDAPGMAPTNDPRSPASAEGACVIRVRSRLGRTGPRRIATTPIHHIHGTCGER